MRTLPQGAGAASSDPFVLALRPKPVCRCIAPFLRKLSPTAGLLSLPDSLREVGRNAFAGTGLWAVECWSRHARAAAAIGYGAWDLSSSHVTWRCRQLDQHTFLDLRTLIRLDEQLEPNLALAHADAHPAPASAPTAPTAAPATRRRETPREFKSNAFEEMLLHVVIRKLRTHVSAATRTAVSADSTAAFILWQYLQ